MKAFRALMIFSAAAALFMTTAGAAYAAPTGLSEHNWRSSHTCYTGEVASGTYEHGLVVRGDCTIPAGAHVTVHGGVTVKPGASLDAITSNSTVKIYGGIEVEHGAYLAIGCSNQLVGEGMCTSVSHDWVHGNIRADRPLTVRIYGINIWGSILVNGGGNKVMGPDASNCEEHANPLNLPIKDSQVHGNIRVVGWTGCWLGVIRNVQHGSTVLLGNRTAEHDSMEIVTNTIHGSLVCYANSPHPQIGDSMGAKNKVSGWALGQCKSVSQRL